MSSHVQVIVSCLLMYRSYVVVFSCTGHRVVQVACGSRDAQTLALTEDGLVYSWGDGDFGKLGEKQCNLI